MLLVLVIYCFVISTEVEFNLAIHCFYHQMYQLISQHSKLLLLLGTCAIRSAEHCPDDPSDGIRMSTCCLFS